MLITRIRLEATLQIMWCCPQCRAFLAHRRGSITFPLCSRLLSPRRRAKNALHYAHGWQIALQIALQVRSEHGGERRRKGEKVGYEEPTTYSKTAHFVIGRSRVQLSPSAPISLRRQRLSGLTELSLSHSLQGRWKFRGFRSAYPSRSPAIYSRS